MAQDDSESGSQEDPVVFRFPPRPRGSNPNRRVIAERRMAGRSAWDTLGPQYGSEASPRADWTPEEIRSRQDHPTNSHRSEHPAT